MQRDEFDPPSGGCHNCWSPYHRRMDCGKPKGKFCKNCGRKDVHVADCPRCGKDYPGWLEQDKMRRRIKGRMIREGTWERDRSLHRGTHLPPYRGPPEPPSHRIPTPSVITPTPHQVPPQPHKKEIEKAGGTVQQRCQESLERPTLAAQASTSTEVEIPYHQRLQNVLRAIAHLSPEMQARIIEPMVMEEDRRQRALSQAEQEGQKK